MAGEEIPIIDLGPYLSDVPGAAETTAAQMRYALENIGFFFVLNHGIAQSLRDRVVAATARFYEQSLDKKNGAQNQSRGGRLYPQ